MTYCIVQKRNENRARCWTSCGIDLEGALHERGDGRRDIWPKTCDRRGTFCQTAGQHHRRRAIDEWSRSRQHLVDNDAECVHIRLGLNWPLPHHLLGRHVAQGTHPEAGRCEVFVCRFESLGDSEVGHKRVALHREKNVLRLDVAMHDPALVRVAERRADITRDCRSLGQRKPSGASEAHSQRLTLDVRHRIPEIIVRRP